MGKWKYPLIGASFIGVFALGSMLGPDLSAATDEKLPIVQTAANEETSQGAYDCPIGGNNGGMMQGMMGQNGSGMHAVIADALGMSEDELLSARQSGKSIADLAKEKGLKIEDITAKMIESRKAAMDQLVKDGKLSQEQADAMLERMEEMMKAAVDRDGFGLMNGRGGGMMGGGRGHMGGFFQGTGTGI